MTEKNGMNRAIAWLFLLYFVILLAERTQSLVRAAAEFEWFCTAFDGFVNVTAAVSLGAAVILLAVKNKTFWQALFAGVEPDYSMLTLTAGVILVSGMVHTEYTIAPIQFGAYGMLIAAMILRTVQLTGSVQHKAALWYSLAYLTVFSMAIPVMYHAHIAQAALFHVIESAVMLALVAGFTVMLRRLFVGQGEHLLLWVPFGVMAVGDAVILWMRWSEEVNLFVLIFAVLSAVMFPIGKAVFHQKGERA